MVRISVELWFLQGLAFFKPVWALGRMGTQEGQRGNSWGLGSSAHFYSLGVAQSYSDLTGANFPSCKITDPHTEMFPKLFPKWGWTTRLGKLILNFRKLRKATARVLGDLR